MADAQGKPASGLESLLVRLLGINPAEMRDFAFQLKGGIEAATADIADIKSAIARIEQRLAALPGGADPAAIAGTRRITGNGADLGALAGGTQPAHDPDGAAT